MEATRSRWKQKFPGRDELVDYFRHLDRVWNLKKDITFSSRVTKMRWDQQTSRWKCEINGGKESITAWTVVLCTVCRILAIVLE